MLLLIDRDILGSFCSALDVETSNGADFSLFFTQSGADDYAICAPEPSGDIRVELDEAARAHYLELAEEALTRRTALLASAKGRKRRKLIDEVAALVVMRRLLRRD